MRTIQSKSNLSPALVKRLLLSALCVALIGCGQGFEAGTGSQHSQSFQSENGDLNRYLNKINAFTYNEDTQSPLLNGEPSTGVVRFYVDLDVPFDPVVTGISRAHQSAKEQLWKDCRPGSDVDISRNYRCGEAPTGKIVSQSRKEIMVVHQKGESGSESGATYSVDGVKVPIYMSRHQKSGTGRIKTLDSRSLKNVDIGYGLLDNVYFRLKPNSGTLETEICIFLPGMKVETDMTHTRARVKKKILWGLTSLKADAKVSVDFGQMSFDSGEFCAIFYARTDENWQTKLDFQKLKAPQLKNLVYKGLKVDVDVRPKGLLKVINAVLKVVGINLEKKAEQKAREQLKEAIQDEAVEIMDGDIRSGAWFHKKLNAEAVLKEALPKVEAQINRNFKYLGPSSENYLQTKFRRACERVADKLNVGSLAEFMNFCKTNIRIKGHLFLKDQDSGELGCYSHFFKPRVRNNNRDKWWGQGCKIRNKIEIIATEEFAPLYHCVSNVMNQGLDGNYDMESCEYELSLLLETTANLKIPPKLKKDFEDMIKNDSDFKKWEEMITEFSL